MADGSQVAAAAGSQAGGGLVERDGATPVANPAALAVVDAARLLTAAGGQRVAPEAIVADVDAGAPTNADGTINLVAYAAWLVREMSGRGD